MKKAYHTAFKEEKAAASRESTSKLDNNNPEAQKKLQEKVEKCQQEVQKVSSLFSSSAALPDVSQLCCDWPALHWLVHMCLLSFCLELYRTSMSYFKRARHFLCVVT